MVFLGNIVDIIYLITIRRVDFDPLHLALIISGKLLKFKFHILIAATFVIFIVSLLYVAPRFPNILAYFWPLLLSTALFLLAVVVFGLTSLPSAQVSGKKVGEGSSSGSKSDLILC
ncbi:hypothetical protein L6452_10008 [Arctium lappa]|uniref:Uncharacterized protein n=1 Tax=Arctium lappa TaxID=4217 RepID=A0ACB9DLH7_ARCLA|nr:hypothetical protein L6452_10008 [Arctium lappa]